jgi:GcrA cell cycle regulator
MTLPAWTDDRVRQLKKLWEAGLSASQIADEFGEVTRNAVIGKLHRLGLTRDKKKKPAKPAPRVRKGYQRARGVNFKAAPIVHGNTALAAVHEVESYVEPDPVVEDSVVPMRRGLSIQDLNETTCRWPIGDPQHPDFFFCGNNPLQCLPYCADHSRIAYQPASERRWRSKR